MLGAAFHASSGRLLRRRQKQQRCSVFGSSERPRIPEDYDQEVNLTGCGGCGRVKCAMLIINRISLIDAINNFYLIECVRCYKRL